MTKAKPASIPTDKPSGWQPHEKAGTEGAPDQAKPKASPSDDRQATETAAGKAAADNGTTPS